MKSRATIKRARESKLLTELQNIHGYRMSLLPEKDSTRMMVTLPTNKSRKPGTMRTVRCVKLTVPDDSALGLALAKDARAIRAARKPVKS